jgi:hypothetical protein
LVSVGLHEDEAVRACYNARTVFEGHQASKANAGRWPRDARVAVEVGQLPMAW